MIYVSTTYPKKEKTNLQQTLSQLMKLDIDGIEIGSTHYFQTQQQFKKIIKNNIKNKKILIHNFFPPISDMNFIINIASLDKALHSKSMEIIMNNIDFCKNIGSDLYTIHPGFLSTAIPSFDFEKNNYDFNFSTSNINNYNKAFDKMLYSLKKIVRHAKSQNVKIAIETEGSFKKKQFLIMQRPKEFKILFNEIPRHLMVNANLSHIYLASKVFKFSIKNFLNFLKPKIAAIELSSNNGIDDQHMPLKKNCINLQHLKLLKINKPVILEFRNCNLKQLKKSINILKNFNAKN